jgi:gluconolactonase
MTFQLLASGYTLVEGPTVGPAGELYFSDVLAGGVYRLSPGGEVETVVPKRRGIGGLALHADGGIVASGRDIVHVHHGETRVVCSIEGVAGWNDLCTDSTGRVYAGALRFAVFDPSATPVPGELWRIDLAGDAVALYGDIIHANGVALSPDDRTIYHSDTRSRAVVVHDLVDEHATNRRIVDTAEFGEPDGLAVDESGAIWVAVLGGFGIGRFTPAGRLDRRVEVPATVVTSVCFAGDDRRDLIVVTADNTDDPARKGCVLRTRVDVAGAPVFPARL